MAETTEVGLEKDQEEFDKAFEEEEVLTEEETKSLDAETKGDETDETGDDPLSMTKDTPATEDDTTQDPPEKSAEELRLQDELDRANNKMATWEGRISAANKRADAAEKAERERQAKEKEKAEKAETLPDDDEAKSIQDFLEEFPDLHKPIVALVKRDLLPMIGQMIDDRLGAIKDVLPEVASIKESIKTDNTAAHFRTITKAHKDWKQIVESGALDKWIGTKPSYTQDALNKVKSEGATEAVVEMFSQYKQDTGQAPAKNTPDEPESKTDKSKDLLAVPSTPNPINTEAREKDKDDFDGAWDEIKGS